MWKEILSVLETKMETPTPYGAYHVMWLIAMVLVIVALSFVSKRHSERKLKWVLGIYSSVAFILEMLKQIIWGVEYNEQLGKFVWDYEWYAFPFQLCTMPIYVCLICLFLNKGKIRDSLLSFIAYTTILGSIASAILPDSLFVSDVLVNVHTMWLHLGSLVVSIYLLTSGEVKINAKSLLRSILVFILVVIIANTLNILVYNLGMLNGETFNMLYISPYFESTLPVFSQIYNKVPYILFLVIYLLALCLGSSLVFFVTKLSEKTKNKFVKKY